MQVEEINEILVSQFGRAVSQPEPTLWQIETEQFRLLVLLSDDQSWLRLLLPIAPVQNANLILEQLLEANFDVTQETRYAIHQNVVWAVFQHSRESLTSQDFSKAVETVIALHDAGFSDYYNQLIEKRIIEVIRVAKQQGQSMEKTLQNLDRFYAEGLMGDLSGSTADREQTLAAWRYQLERLWTEVE